MSAIDLRKEGMTAVLKVTNPPANALSQSVIAEIGQAVDQVGKDATVKVCVITGAGSMFIAGADIKELSDMDITKGQMASQAGQRVLNRIEQMDKPWIAAINGACLGGGMELAMACHMRIATETAKMGQPEIKLGIIPGFGGTQRLPRLANIAKAYELILTGGMITGLEAKTLGLVNKAVPEGQALPEALVIAGTISSYGWPAIRAAMQSVRRSLPPIEEGLMFEAERFGKLCGTADMHEGMKAFLEKRAPAFGDR